MGEQGLLALCADALDVVERRGGLPLAALVTPLESNIGCFTHQRKFLKYIPLTTP